MIAPCSAGARARRHFDLGASVWVPSEVQRILTVGNMVQLVMLDLMQTQGLSPITKTLHYGCTRVKCWGVETRAENQVQWDTDSKNHKMESDLGRHPTSTSDLHAWSHMCMNACVHTHR